MQINAPKNASEVQQLAGSDRDHLLQIIAGTTDLMEDIWTGDHGSSKYLAMLRASVEHAANITAHLVEQGSEREAADDTFDQGDDEDPLPVSERRVPRRPRILAVDDEPAALLLFHELLTLAGYHVETARSGFECLDRVSRERSFDVLVLDLTMPFMDGEETFRRLRAVAPEVPVIITTGFIDPDRLKNLYAAGLFAFLSKPLAPDDFLEQVANAVAARKAAAESSLLRGTAAA
ncbi:MAG: response regulator [Chthoniobacterales bacterium]|nr:response regulator [Chthoniobacterales bacterium]